MLTHGADAALVQAHVTALAQRLGYDVQLLVLAEGLLLTIEDGRSFRTKLGHVVSGMNVNMSALIALDEIVRQAPAAAIDRRLDAVEHAADCYPRWLVVLGMGLTAASLSRLFGGTWPVVGVSALVGVVNLLVRQVLSHWSMNPIAIAGLTALTSGLVGALLMRLFPEDSPTLCLVAAGMILVPGVPLLNGVREMLGSHVVTGIARLMVGTVTVHSIAFGLFIAARIAGDAFSIDAQDSMLPVHEDFIFSASDTRFCHAFQRPTKSGLGLHCMWHGWARVPLRVGASWPWSDYRYCSGNLHCGNDCAFAGTSVQGASRDIRFSWGGGDGSGILRLPCRDRRHRHHE
jgi:uncharacterized membrane protein YjjP (DUF1212 family)